MAEGAEAGDMAEEGVVVALGGEAQTQMQICQT
jgi:hypothetical protein